MENASQSLRETGDNWYVYLQVLMLYCWRYDDRVGNGHICMLYVWTGVETATPKWGARSGMYIHVELIGNSAYFTVKGQQTS